MSAPASAAGPMAPQPAVIRSSVRETPDTFTLTVEPDSGLPVAPYAPGQFSMLYVFGVAELPISMSGSPADAGRLHYTVRAVGQATHSLVHQPVGGRIGVRGPFGTAWPVDQARGKDVLVVAGGIGLAPLRPVIYSVLARRSEFGRLILLYGARAPRDLLYRRELARWKRAPGAQVLTTVDYGGLSWRGHVGVVTQLFRYVRLDAGRTLAMVCGPEIMMRFVLRELEERGVDERNVYLSMERNMKCAVGWCGHCQLGPYFLCKDGPVFRQDRIAPWMKVHEL